MKKNLLLFIFATFCFASDSFAPSLGILYNEAKAELGKKIFFDKRLSDSEQRSCEGCHNLYWDFSGTTRKNLQNNTVNPPSILNSALNHIFFKDGSVRDIYSQVKISITSKAQLDTSEHDFVKKINNISEYRLAFAKIYSDGVNFDNAVDALVEFERAVLTVGSPFDRFLMGDSKALNKDEIRGFELFQEVGCVSCHNGVNLGTNLMQQLSFYKSVFENTSDANVFEQKIYRVPSLRNIARTAPYMSDGSFVFIKDAIVHVADIQLMHKFNKEDINYIYKFLLTLNGELPRILK